MYTYQHGLLSELPTCYRVAVGNDSCQIKYKLCTYMEQVLDQNTFRYVQVVTVHVQREDCSSYKNSVRSFFIKTLIYRWEQNLNMKRRLCVIHIKIV